MKKTIYILSILLLTISGVSAQTVIKIKQPNPQQITIADDSIKLNGSTSVPLSDIIKPITLAEYNAMDAATKLKNAGRQIIDPTGVPTAISIVDGSVSTAKIANSAVSGIKILDEAITESKIADASITDAKINADTYNKLYYAVPDGYISPRDYGAVLDGVTDDRAAFVATLAAANTLGKRIRIDADKMFLDVEETGTKSIFIPDNTWIEGSNKDVQIVVNNILSPAFYLALVDNVTIKDITFTYDQTYDPTYGEDATNFAADFTINQQQVRDYLRDNKAIDFSGVFPVDNGFVSYYYMFLLEAAENVTFDNVTFKSKGETADTFITGVIKMKEQYQPSQTVSNTSAPRTQCKNISLSNIVIDGALMGIQGLVDGFTVNNLKSYRYSDMQDASGNYLGGFDGVDYDFPPPHLFYLNNSSSSTFNTKNVNINDVYDYGKYVGTASVRGTSGINIGYCNSLKLVETQDNVHVSNYKSFRRDGMADIGILSNSSFSNMYSESTTDIFSSTSSYPALRFLGNLTNVVFDNIIIKDNSTTSAIYPIDYGEGNFVTWNNVHVFVKTLNTIDVGTFGIWGSNNKITNSSFNIENHTSTQTLRGIVLNNSTTRDSGANNYYDVTLNGWRDISSDPLNRKSRMLFATAVNTNNNYARVHDTRNNFVIEQVNEIETDTWTRTETVSLGSGTQQALTMTIPSGFAVKKATAIVTSALDAGVTASIGTVSGVATNLIASISNTANSINSNDLNEISNGSLRQIFIRTSTGTFASTGTVKVTLVLTRTSLN
ncbi:pectate lyase [Cellulophaga phage phi13:2]|uniref:Pectate lyase n=1 Tax=Cellulophaga phage phi13:2 TaxID=1328030 RepID=S0A2Q6_9CAUD|nr:pectate lyase [Cellulophaga phage phi13:2]AGO49696.1 pectate lyase [Cellulophaga phage phi13:2]